jgi:hypothetical protein
MSIFPRFYEYNRAGFAYNHVSRPILLFQVELDELYLMTKCDFRQPRLYT